ncbi:MAG TPA: FHA domain-containing protein [Anaeromyxobacteraceae bacterium]|nr:FHA domain-containing protein [Anaeromyxobacteraceae bacterium]
MKRTARDLPVDDDLWEALGLLAARLGQEREALLHQALHAFLRFHGALPEAAEPGQPPREAAVRRVLETARELEQRLQEAPAALTLVGEHGPIARVTVERFLIGRGRHCDLVIDSVKVSREHAVIRREPDGWWIEDLGSSNGTWHQQVRVDRRKIADGDEYYVCAEKIRCVLSPSSP